MVGRISLSVVALIFLLIPGLFGMKAFLRAYIKLDDLSRFDKLAVILTIGIFALAIPPLALNWNCWTGHLTSFLFRWHVPGPTELTDSATWCSDTVITFGNMMLTEQLSDVPLVIIISFLGVQTAFVTSLSYVIGRILNGWGDGPPREPKFIEQPWEYASKKTARESDNATVITTQGEEIRGTVHRIGSPSEDYDILLKDPEKVVRDDRTDVEVDTRDLGAYTYHHYRDISRIRFPNLDTYEEYEIDLEDASRRFEEEVGSRADQAPGEGGSSDVGLPPRTG